MEAKGGAGLRAGIGGWARVVTAAEYLGDENIFLESKRKQLYRDFPPSDEFKRWMKTLSGKKIAKPPIITLTQVQE